MIPKALLVFSLALVLVGACTNEGGSSPTDARPAPSTIPETTTTTALPTDAIEAFHACLGDSGFDIEPISLDASGRPRLDLVMVTLDYTDPEVSSAISECSPHLTTGALDLSGSPLIAEEVLELLTEFSECIRSRGVPGFPDPLPGFTGIGGPYPAAEIPLSDPDLEPAIDECRDRLAGAAG